MAGIEPASVVVPLGLLRVQLAMDFLGPSALASKFADGPSRLSVPSAPTTSAESSGPLDDASYRVGSTPGLTDFRTRSGGECEVGAVGIGTCGLRRALTR